MKRMTKRSYPKVLIGNITFEGKEYVLDRFMKRVKEFTYPNFDFLVIDNSKGMDYFNKIKEYGVHVIKTEHYEDTRENVCKSRNLLVEKFLESDAEFLFHLEQDVIPKKDIIEELIQWNKPVVGGWYYVNQGSYLKRPCLFKGFVPMVWDGKKIVNLDPYTNDELVKERLMKIYLGSMGVTLFKREIFEKHKIRFKWFKALRSHDDSWFYHECDVRGIDVYVDTDLLVCHFQSDWARRIENKLEFSHKWTTYSGPKQREIEQKNMKRLLDKLTFIRHKLYGEEETKNG